MDWNSTSRPFLSRLPESSFNFLYNYNLDQYPGAAMAADAQQGLVLEMEKNSYGNLEKKKRLTSEQLDSLERSFQEEIKLDPDRKTRLSRELGLQPRQIAIWFQNRRARWKAKQLEHLYDTLKHEFDTINREKQKLQEEVMKLKIMLREQSGSRKQVSTVYTDVSGEETVESTSVAIRCSTNPRGTNTTSRQITECNYLYNMEDYNPVSPPFWGALPSYPQ